MSRNLERKRGHIKVSVAGASGVKLSETSGACKSSGLGLARSGSTAAAVCEIWFGGTTGADLFTVGGVLSLWNLHGCETCRHLWQAPAGVSIHLFFRALQRSQARGARFRSRSATLRRRAREEAVRGSMGPNAGVARSLNYDVMAASRIDEE